RLLLDGDVGMRLVEGVDQLLDALHPVRRLLHVPQGQFHRVGMSQRSEERRSGQKAPQKAFHRAILSSSLSAFAPVQGCGFRLRYRAISPSLFSAAPGMLPLR